MNNIVARKYKDGKLTAWVRGRGSKITISISKIKKIRAMIKNCRENGTRDVWYGSNPHSKGVVNARLIKFLWAVSKGIIISISPTIKRNPTKISIIVFIS